VSPTGFLEATPGVDFRTIEDIRERKHLDEPIPIQYLYWVKEVTTE
jgi:ABC-type dipeptide/oligopeptide/nickel transport system permease component